MDSIQSTFTDALNSDRPTLAMFYDVNDPHCREQEPVLEEASDRMSGKAHFFAINKDTEPELVSRYHVHAYPTFILFVDGQESWRTTGRTPAHELEDMVSRFV